MKKSTIKMTCRVFIDDFEKSLNESLKKNIKVESLTKEGIAGIEEYFGMYYSIAINGKTIPLKYHTAEVQMDYNVMTIRFAESNLKIKKGEKLLVENVLFFDEFGTKQENRIGMRFPPFFEEKNFQAKLKKYSFSYTF